MQEELEKISTAELVAMFIVIGLIFCTRMTIDAINQGWVTIRKRK